MLTSRPKYLVFDGIVIGALALAVVCFFKEMFTAHGLIFHSELFEFNYPFYEFIMAALRQGVLPLWVPHVFCGVPLIANIELGLCSPLILPLYALFRSTSFNIIIPLYFFLAGVFMYAYGGTLGLSRPGRFIAALVFMFNGFMLDRHAALYALGTLIWLPLILFFIERSLRTRRFSFMICAGMAMGMQFMAGLFQESYFNVFLLVGYFAWKFNGEWRQTHEWKGGVRLLGMLLTVILIGGGMFSVQLLPTYELVTNSARNQMQYEHATQEEGQPFENNLSLAEIIFPRIFGGICSDKFIPAHMGVLPVLLALIAVCGNPSSVKIFYAGVAGCSFLLAFGYLTPLFWLLYHLHLPGFHLFKAPDRFIYLTIFAIAVLAGMGFDTIMTAQGTKDKRRICITLVQAVFVIATTIAGIMYRVGTMYIPQFGRLLPTRSLTTAPWKLFAQVKTDGVVWLSVVALFVFLVIMSYANRIPRKLLRWCIPGLVFINLWVFGKDLIKMIDRRQAHVLTDRTATLDYLGTDRGRFRIFSSDENPENDPALPRMSAVTHRRALMTTTPETKYANNLLILNTGIPFDIHSAAGNLTLPLLRYLEYTKAALDIDPVRRDAYREFLQYPNMVSLLNCKYVLSRADTRDAVYRFSTESAYQDAVVRIQRNAQVLPRAFLVSQALVLRDKQQILDWLKNPLFDPRACVILEEEGPLKNADLTAGTAQASLERYEPNEVVVCTTSRVVGYLVLLDTYYPGWKVSVDGVRSKIYRANYLFRAVPVTAGSHRVRFWYDPVSFRLGLTLTVTTILVSMLMLVFARRREHGEKHER